MRREKRLLEEILGRGGLLSKVVRGYDWRPQQLDMGLATLDALFRERILLVEAPTGVGKTMAYLVPAALYARAKREPVVISSYTKALQDQILRQDVPRLRRLVHPDLRVVSLKGRDNYLCRRRWELFMAEEGAGPDGNWVVERLQEWVFGTETGDFAEAPDLGRRGAWVRARIGGEAHVCRSRLCRADDGCFHKKARREARGAELLVVNHSLLLADALGADILPDHRALIIDEAHLFPDAAVGPLSREISEKGFIERVRLMGGAGEPGVSDRMRRLLRLLPGEVAARNLTGKVRVFEEATRERVSRSRLFFEALRASEVFPPAGERRRFGAADVEHLLPAETDDFLAFQSAHVGSARRLLGDIAAEIPSGGLSPELQSGMDTATGWIEELAEALETLEALLSPQPQRRVPILEASPGRGAVLSSVPLDTGPEIREHVLNRCCGVVLTSATLGAGDDFAYYAGEVGLEPGEARALQLPSAFALEEQLGVLVPSYAVDPRQPGYEASLARAVADLVRGVDRKTLVLFTSHETLERVRALLAATLGDADDMAGIELLAQTRAGTKERLSESFRRAKRAVLLGTTSFWYGVDFPGDELEVLIITRLPFPVPTDPRVAALAEALEVEGRSAFREYALPGAVLRFRQGLGRLIRRGADRGVCVVLDPRIMRAGYGRDFQKILPAQPVVVGSPAELVARATAWFERGAQKKPATNGDGSAGGS
jgi:Rad3-related DNA helicase